MKIFLIYAGTGCTCCNEENHYRGPYKTKEDAERRIAYYKSKDSKYWPLASQYARRGAYSIKECEAEAISNGRYIISHQVFEALDFIEVKDDGTVEKDNEEHFTGEYL